METHNLRNIIWLEACIVTPTSTKGLVAGYGAMWGDCSAVQHVIDIWYCGIGAGICGSGYIVELQTKVSKFTRRLHYRGQGPYYGLLLVESTY